MIIFQCTTQGFQLFHIFQGENIQRYLQLLSTMEVMIAWLHTNYSQM